MVVGVNCLHHSEDKSYTDKVTKSPFSEAPSGYEAAAKRSAWGGKITPSPLTIMRVKNGILSLMYYFYKCHSCTASAFCLNHFIKRIMCIILRESLYFAGFMYGFRARRIPVCRNLEIYDDVIRHAQCAARSQEYRTDTSNSTYRPVT